MAKKQKLGDFDWQVQKVVPTLIKGKDALNLYKTLEKERAKFRENSGLNSAGYNPKNEEIYGSNVAIAGVVNRLVASFGLRVAIPGDDVNRNIYNLIKGRYYTDFNSLVAQEKKPSNERNTGLWKRVIELAEEKLGRSPQFPFRIDGFYVQPDETEKGYGIKIVPADNFQIVEDERFSSKYNRKKFTIVDKNGVPADLGDNGRRTNFIRDNGLSRVCLSGAGDLGASYDYLADSNDYGRVVLIADEVGAQNFAQKRLKELQSARDLELSRVNEAYTKAEEAFKATLRKK
jgi:hypothetical protein